MADQSMVIRVRLSGGKAAATEAKVLGHELQGVGRGASIAERHSRRMGRGFVFARKGLGPLRAGVSGLTGALGFGAAVGLAGAFKVSYEEALQARQGHKAVAAELKATHGAANISATGVDNLSRRLGRMAAVDDDVIRQGELMLLSFRNIRNEGGKTGDIFNQTSKAAVNMSAFFQAAGKSMTLSDAMLQIGKAVNDPAKGMTRLTRIGVTFTQQQIDQAKHLSETGHRLAAQRIILRELNKEFGGAAGAQARANPMQRLNVVLRDLAQTIGTAMLPYIDKAARGITRFVMGMQRGTGAGGKFIGAMRKVGSVLGPVFRGFGKFAGMIAKVWGWLFRLAKANVHFAVTAGRFIGRTAAMIGRSRIFQAALHAVTTAFHVVVGAVKLFVGIARPVIGAIVKITGGVIRLIARLGVFRAAWAGVKFVLRAVGDGIAWVIDKFTGMLRTIQRLIDAALRLKNALNDVTPGGPTAFDSNNLQDLVGRLPGQGGPLPRVPRSSPRRTTAPRGNPRSGGKRAIPRGGISVPTPAPAGGQGGGGPAVIEVPVHLDGKVIARVVARHTQDTANRR